MLQPDLLHRTLHWVVRRFCGAASPVSIRGFDSGGGEVVRHQDASFLATEPQSVIGFWFALEDATRENGCLWVEPGGHRGPLRERYVNRDGRLTMEALDATPWPEAERTRALEVAAGTLVVFDGRLPHASGPNCSAQSRMAYTLHAVDAGAVYSPLNWLQRGPEFAARGFA